MQTLNAMFYLADDNIASKENEYPAVAEIQDEIHESAYILLQATSADNEIYEINTYIMNEINIFIGEEVLHKKCNNVPLQELQIKLSRIDDSILHKIAKKNESYKKTITKRKCSTKLRI